MTDNNLPPRERGSDQVIAAIQQRIGGLPLPGWPVFGLADLEDEAWLCGVGENGGGVRVVRIDYRSPDGRERLLVQSQPSGSSRPQAGAVLDQLERDEDEGEPLRLLDDPLHPFDDSASQADVLIDNQPVPAVLRHRGSSTAYLLQASGVTILVGARHVSMGTILLRRVHDLEPLKQRRAQIIEHLVDLPDDI